MFQSQSGRIWVIRHICFSRKFRNAVNSKHNQSTAGDPGIVGIQPLSLISRARSSTKLTDDEIAGVAWLYKYFVTKDINDKTVCIIGFQYEAITGGCLPIGGLMGEHSKDSVCQAEFENSKMLLDYCLTLPVSPSTIHACSEVFNKHLGEEIAYKAFNEIVSCLQSNASQSIIRSCAATRDSTHQKLNCIYESIN